MSYSLAELGELVAIPRRTIRYYIQQGLLPPPSGAGRGAKYGTEHLERLLEIRKWQDAGLSLERIAELLDSDTDALLPPPRPRQPGSVEVKSHIYLDEGIELVIDPGQADLTPEQVRELGREVLALYERIRKGESS